MSQALALIPHPPSPSPTPPSPPLCRHCHEPSTQKIVEPNTTPESSHIGRPYFICENAACGLPQKTTWVAWGDEVGLHTWGPSCECEVGCRLTKSTTFSTASFGRVRFTSPLGYFWSCANGQCGCFIEMDLRAVLRRAREKGVGGEDLEGLVDDLLGVGVGTKTVEVLDGEVDGVKVEGGDDASEDGVLVEVGGEKDEGEDGVVISEESK